MYTTSTSEKLHLKRKRNRADKSGCINPSLCGQLPLTFIVLQCLTIVFCTHVNRGCISYAQKANLISGNKTTLQSALKSQASWCTDVDMIPLEIRNNPTLTHASSNSNPFLIHTFNFTRSNAIRVKIRGRKPHSKKTLIQELIIQARAEDAQPIGKFLSYPFDVQLACCQNPLDHNTARIHRTDPPNQNSSVNFLWIPSGFLEDFEGPFNFIVTVVNGEGKYWSNFKSTSQIARRSVKLDQDDDEDP